MSNGNFRAALDKKLKRSNEGGPEFEAQDKEMAQKPKKREIGHVLMEALTADQLVELLNAIFPAGGQLDRLIENLEAVDADLAATLRAIAVEAGAEEKAQSPPQTVTSLRRDLELWEALWQKWEAHVLALGDEEGKYASQENHWEAPRFDGYELACDLEAIAEKMLPLIDRVFDEVGAPDLFLETIAEIEDGIKAYPEWMGAEYDDGCCFKRHASRCVLHWCWRACEKEIQPGTALVQKVLTIENDYDHVCLDAEATIAYFAQLPDETCLEVYNLLQAGKTVFDLDQVHSVWHRIHHAYQARFDSGRHLESCAAHLSENWRYGHPLVEDAVGRGDWQAAESWLEKTFASLLGPRRKMPWFPESDLLVAQARIYSGIEAEEIVSLLELWTQAARALGLDHRANAAEFQAVVLQELENWDAVLAAYAKTAGMTTHAVIAPLWEQWKNEMVGRSVRRYLEPGDGSTWIHWLLDALVEGRAGAQSFLNRVDAWLKTLKSDGAAFENQWRSLALLTDDLDPEQRLPQQYPHFCRAALWEGLPAGNPTESLAAARRRALSQIDAGTLFPGILAVWKQHLHRIVPDPATAHKSNYNHHATWAAAVQEFNPDRFKSLIERWRETHNRRRNLWRDLKAQGLPV